MSKNRIAQVRVALLGYQPGDRVIVNKVMGNWPDIRKKPGVILSQKWNGHECDWLLVRFDEEPRNNGKDEGWWVERAELEPE